MNAPPPLHVLNELLNEEEIQSQSDDEKNANSLAHEFFMNPLQLVEVSVRSKMK